jgi:hypothetical protein
MVERTTGRKVISPETKQQAIPELVIGGAASVTHARWSNTSKSGEAKVGNRARGVTYR